MFIKRILFLLLLLIIALSVGYKKFWPESGIAFSDREKYVLKETYENSQQKFRGLYELNNKFVRLELDKNIDKEQADNLVKLKLEKFFKLFDNEIAPYPGEVSTVTACSDNLRPKAFKVNTVNFYTGFLNSRQQFGSCDKDRLMYHGLITYLYCTKNKTLYQVEYFFDKGMTNQEREIENFVSSLKCR